MEKLMTGKKGLIMGLTNDRSISWATAKLLHEQGAELAFSFTNEKIMNRTAQLTNSLGTNNLYICNVEDSKSVTEMFEDIEKKWGKIDFILHSIAFSDKDELKGHFVDTSLNNFLHTMHISCFSFIEIAKHAKKLMKDGGSLLTYTYYGSEKVMPNYNVMGVAKAALESSVKYLAEDLGPYNIRVNSISAGPIKTLAASGIGNFNDILKWCGEKSPLRKNVTQESVGKSSLYLLSDMSDGVTGEIHYVDSGYNIIGMKTID